MIKRENKFPFLFDAQSLAQSSSNGLSYLSKNQRNTSSIFPQGSPDQYSIVFVFDPVGKQKSWVWGWIIFNLIFGKIEKIYRQLF